MRLPHVIAFVRPSPTQAVARVQDRTRSHGHCSAALGLCKHSGSKTSLPQAELHAGGGTLNLQLFFMLFAFGSLQVCLADASFRGTTGSSRLASRHKTPYCRGFHEHGLVTRLSINRSGAPVAGKLHEALPSRTCGSSKVKSCNTGDARTWESFSIR